MSDIPATDQQIIEKEVFGARPKERARFYLHGARDEDASQAAGHPVYAEKVYVEIKVPDDKDFMSRPATKADFRQYPDSYAHFERVRDFKQHRLDLLPGMSVALLATAQALGLFTIEQLAAHTPENAPWRLSNDEDPYPVLAGELPAALQDARLTAKRFVNFANKPRVRLVDGALQEVA